MGTLIGAICERLTGHRFDHWTRVDGFYSEGEWRQPRFSWAQCRWCRQEYVQPIPR